MKPVVYLICGVSGSGKSWVCEQLKHQAKYVSFDRTSKEEALSEMLKATIPVLYDPTVHISTFIKRHSDKLDIRPFFVLGDFLKVKQQIKKRGGTITKGLYKRWERMIVLSQKTNAMTGSSNEIVKFLKTELTKTVQYLIYKATSPSNKVYIGKTSSLAARIAGHKHDALVRNKPWAFSNAIRKYGIENIKFDVLKEGITNFYLSSFLEKKYIQEYKSNNRVYGYNLTTGGEGCQAIADVVENKQIALRTFYSSQEGLKVKDKLSAKTKIWHLSESGRSARQKSAVKRSTRESRNLTSILNRERYKSEEARQTMSQVMQKVYTSSDLRQIVSEATKKAKAKPFQVSNASGIIGTWLNSTDCAKDLGINRSGISAALNGHRPTYKGFIFKWLSDGEYNVIKT